MSAKLSRVPPHSILFGAIIGIALTLFLVRLWQPRRQIERHSENLLTAVAQKNWGKFAALIAVDYRDEWGNDRASAVARTREVFRYVRGVRFTSIAPTVGLESEIGSWRARIVIDGEDNEVMEALKTRLNALQTPFELRWQHRSGKPWDWQLVSVRNSDLVLPEEY